jgi:hypothetical protein
MVKYDLSHLTQEDNQNVSGPIQDDEALFLFAIIRGCRLNRILEIGGLDGYSAKNFLQALNYPQSNEIHTKTTKLYTCDIHEVPSQGENHKIIVKNAIHLTAEDVDNEPLDMVFFDCHDMVQMGIYNALYAKNIITNETIIALHDTNLHYIPYNHKWHYPPFDPIGTFIPDENAYAHQPVERQMVNIFKDMGYDVFSIDTNATKHYPEFPVRHGITVCKKFKTLK